MIVDAKPYEYTFDPEKTALLVIDMQRFLRARRLRRDAWQ